MKMANINRQYPRQAVRLCAEIINAVTGFPTLPSIVDLEALHASVSAKFDAVIKHCRVKSLPESAALELIYPLAALVDETLLSDPGSRGYWAERPLQLRYFGEVLAGTKFFAKLDAHTQADEPCVEILEAYFVSLALGLKGMYGGDEARRCSRVMESLGVMLMDIRAKGGGEAEAVDRREKPGWPARAAVIASLIGATAVSALATAAYYAASLNSLYGFLGGF
jgi:type IV/VI secretion system ImpK/VasF family protein